MLTEQTPNHGERRCPWPKDGATDRIAEPSNSVSCSTLATR